MTGAVAPALLIYPRVLFRPPGLTRSAVETLLRSSMMVAYLFGAIRELKSG